MKRDTRITTTVTALLFAALTVTTVFLSRTLTGALERQIEDVRDGILETVTELTLQDITWKTVSPSVLRSVTFYGVAISTNATADSVSVGINLRNILLPGGGSPVSSVDIVRADVSLYHIDDWNRLEQTVQFAMSAARQTPDLAIRFRDSRVSGIREGLGVALTDLKGVVQLNRTGVIQGEMTASGSVQPSAGDSFSGRGDLDISFQRDSRSAPVQVSVDARRIISSHFTLEDQSFHLEAADTAVTVRRVKSDSPLDLLVRYNSRSGDVSATFQAADLVPADIVRLRGPWAQYDPWLHAPLSGGGTVAYHLTDGFLGATGSVKTRLVNADVLPEPIGLDLRVEVDRNRIYTPAATVYGRTGSVTLSGTYHFGYASPNGKAVARNFTYPKLPGLDGTVVFSGGPKTGGFTSDGLALDGLDLYHLVASYRQNGGGRYTTELSGSFDRESVHTVNVTGSYLDIRDFTGEVIFRRLTTTMVTGLAGTAGFADVPAAADLPAAIDSLEFTGSIRFDRRGDDVTVRFPYVVGTDPAAKDRLATIRGGYRNGTITVDQFVLRSDGFSAGGNAFVRIASGGTVDFETSLDINGIDYSFRGLYSGGDSLIILGPYGIQARAAKTAQGTVRIRASALDVPLPMGSARVSVNLDGLVLSPRDWYITFQDIRFRDLPMPAGGTASIDMAFSLKGRSIDVALLRFEDSVGSLSGSLRVEYLLGPAGEISGSGRFASSDGTEQYRLVGRYSSGSLAADIRMENAPLRRVSGDIQGGTVSGAVQLVGNRSSPQVRAFLESDAVRVGGQDLRFSLRLYGDDQKIELSDTELAASSRQLRIDSLTLQRESGALSGSALFTRPDDQGEVAVTVTGRTDPVSDLVTLSLRDLPATLTIRTSAQTTRGRLPPSEEVHTYSLVKGRGRTDLFREDGAIRAVFLEGGAFELALLPPLPITADAKGSIRNGEITLTAAGVEVDLTALSLPLTDAGISIPQGVARGSVRVLGPVGNPDLFGTLRVSDLMLVTPFSPDQIGPVNAALILEEKTVRVPSFETKIGEAPLVADGGILINRWNLGEYRLNLDIPGPAGARIVNAFGPLDVNGFVRGNLTLRGGPRDLLLDGRLVTYNTEMGVIPLSTPRGSRNPMNLAINLTIETGRGARFVWPASDFPIIRSFFAVGQEVELRLDSQEDTFSLTGAVDIQTGDVFYFDRNFLIREGEIVFQENQDRFDPRITARAELREVSSDGPVRIYLVADGQRLSEFSPRFESNPPLDGSEIVAILGGNIFQQDLERGSNLSTALLTTSDIFAQFGVFREFENEIRERFGLDLFAIRTSVIQNLLLTAIAPTDEAIERLAPTLGTYLNNTSIFMGRYIGESVFAQGIIQMRSADAAEIDSTDGIQRLGGVLIDSEISLEWQTPLFTLEWSLAPEHPEELFIRDNTFTFSWSFMY